MAERIAYDQPFRERLILARALNVSEKRLLGWEPRETHDHEYDDAGLLVRTVVSREAEWDDMERAKMLALADYEADLCACGFPKDVADTDPDLQLKYRTCPVCAGLAQAARQQQASDEEATRSLGKEPAPGAARPADGRHFAGLEPLTVED